LLDIVRNASSLRNMWTIPIKLLKFVRFRFLKMFDVNTRKPYKFI
jgi:hypothetical protein